MLPVPINKTQTVNFTGSTRPEIPIISQTIIPAYGVARNFLFENSLLCSSKVLLDFSIFSFCSAINSDISFDKVEAFLQMRHKVCLFVAFAYLSVIIQRINDFPKLF